MYPMTWGEFKAFLHSKGVKDEDEIGYIDVSLPGTHHDVEVRLPDEGDRLRVLDK